MDIVHIILTVCALAGPAHCEDRRISIEWAGPLTHCAMSAPPFIAQWVDEHPNWRAERWRCVYPGSEDEKV